MSVSTSAVRSPAPAPAVADRPALRLRIFAYHVQLISRRLGRFTVYPMSSNHAYDVNITASDNGREWDQVTINGKWCGNRSGGVTEFSRLVMLENPTIHADDD